MPSTLHEIRLGPTRHLLGGWIFLLLPLPQLVREWGKPEAWWLAALYALVLFIVIPGMVRTARFRPGFVFDDVGIGAPSAPRAWNPFARERPTEPPQVLWSEIRTARFETPHITEPTKRVLVLDLPAGERRLTLVEPGMFRLRDPARFVTGLRGRGFDVTWPEDAR